MLEKIKTFIKSITLADFWKSLISSKSDMSSTRFIAIFSGVILPLGWIALSFYCAIHKIGMPGGSTEGFIGLFTIATLGKAYTSYTEMKTITSPDAGTTTTTESTSSKKEVTNSKDG